MLISVVCPLLMLVLLFLLFRLRGSLLLPICPGPSQSLTVTLRSSGDDPALENTVNGLLWLRGSGALPAEIVIEDAGMSLETRRVAQLLERRHACIDFQTIVEDSEWESRNT